MNADLYDFFPPNYFESSFCEVINIHSQEYSEIATEIEIKNNTFSDERNV